MGMMNTVRAQFTATAQGFKSVVQGIVADTRRIGSSTQQSIGEANKHFSSFGGTVAKIGGAYLAFKGVTEGLSGLGEATIGANADMETYQNTLTTLMGSQKEAVKTMDWAVKFAAQTPFEIPEIVDATAKLTAYGINAKDVMTDVGNMAAVMGKPLDQAVEAVADAQTGELERLKEFGITKQMLIDKAQSLYGKELVNSKGQITDMKLLNKTLFAIMKERYHGGMDIASRSFKGMVSNIKDSMGTIAREMSKPVFDKLKQGLQVVTPIMSALVAMIKGDVKGAMQQLTDAFGADKAAQIMGFFNKIRDGGLAVVAWFKSFAPTVSNLGTIFSNLAPVAGAAFAGVATAIGLVAKAIPPIVNGVTSVVAAFTSWRGFLPLVTGLATAFITFKGTITAITTATRAYNAVMAAVAIVQRTARAATLAYTIAGGGARGVMLAMRAAALQLNMAFLANPIVLIVALIAGLVAALVIAYNKSETFRNAVQGVWGALKGAFSAALSWLSNFFTVTIPAMWASAMTFFQSIWTWLVGFFSKWGTTILMVLAPFIGIPLWIYQHWQQIVAFLTAVWNTVKAAVTPIIKGFIDWIKNAFDNFVSNMKTILNPIIDFFRNTWNNIKLLVLGIVGVFINLLLGRFDDVKLSLKAIWTAIKRQITDTITAIKETGLAIFKVFSTGIKNIWNAIKSAATSVWNSIKSSVTSIWNSLKSSVLSVANSLKSSVISAWNSIKSGVVNAVNSLKLGAMSAWNSLKSSITSAVSSIRSYVSSGFNGAKSAAINAFNALRSGVSNVINSVKSYVSNMKSSIISTFRGINLSSVGRNIIMGLYNGITGAAGAVYRKASEIANNITSKIKKALSIHSPSRVMAEIGQFTGQGLVNGMENMRKKVGGMADKLATSMKSPFGTTISNVGNATVQSIHTVKHLIDLANVPPNIDETTLVNMLYKAIGNPKLQKAIDRVNFKNNNNARLPQGR